MVILRTNKNNIHILMNICKEPAQGYFCDEQGNATKQLVVKQDGQQLLH